MARILCRYNGCINLDDGYCGAAKIQLDPDEGCLTFSRRSRQDFDEDWEDENDDLTDFQDEGYEDELLEEDEFDY
jgi:hypothetical protein